MREILSAHGCTFLRKGKGDHELWRCPKAKRPIVVDGRIMSRHLAKEVLKQVGINARL